MSNVANPSTPREGNQREGNQRDGNLAAGLQHQAEEAGSFVAEKANEAGKYVSDTAKSVASSAMHSAEHAASYMGDQAGNAKSAVGSSIKSVADSLRSACPEEEGMMKGAACSVADTLETAGTYIADQDFAAMGQDVTNMIKRNPIPAVLIAAGVGFLLAKAVTSNRSNY